MDAEIEYLLDKQLEAVRLIYDYNEKDQDQRPSSSHDSAFSRNQNQPCSSNHEFDDVPQRSTSMFYKAYKISLTVFPTWIPPFLPGYVDSRKPLHSTAWLDGVRGVAAIGVVITHTILIYRLDLLQILPDHKLLFIEWPIIRLVFSGGAMVALFFVISGYCLSYRPLQLIQTQHSSLLDSLASSVFRRWMRLWLPTTVSLFLSLLITITGWYGHGFGSREPVLQPTVIGQFWSWWESYIGFSDIFQLMNLHNDGNMYDQNLWTIPLEFNGSVIVFLTLTALAHTKRNLRLFFMTALDSWALYRGHMHVSLFLGGILCAELNLRRSQNNQIIFPEKPLTRLEKLGSNRILRISLVSILLLISLLLLSFPYHDERPDSAYSYLRDHAPNTWKGYPGDFGGEWFYITIGALLFVFLLDGVESLQRVFTTRIAQYLGYISFAIYLCHGPFLFSFGWRMMPHFLNAFGADHSGVGSWFGYAFGGATILFCLIWVADIFTRVIDEPSVRFAKWIVGKSFERSQGPSNYYPL